MREVASYLKGADLKKLSQEAKELADIFWPQPRPLTGEQKRRRKYERRRHLLYGVGLIEQQFGRAKEAELRNPKFPFCLDDIFAGRRVKMIRLQELFGIARKQLDALHHKVFKQKLPCVKRGQYDWHAVLEIFEALLKPQRRKRRGRPRTSWLSDPSLRARVLRGMEARIFTLPNVPPKIARAFQKLIESQLPNVGAK